MDFALKTVFCFIVFIFSWLYQEQNYQWDITHQMMKEASNLAVHDAILQPIPSLMAEGQLVIDPVEAREIFEETLQINLGLSEALAPIEGSPLRTPVQILEFIVFDDSNTIFPYLYENETYHVVKYLHGPAAFAVIKTDYPKFINTFGSGTDIKVPAIQEYKLDILYP